MNTLDALLKASSQFTKTLGLTPLKSSEGLTAEIVVTHTDEFRIKATDRQRFLNLLEAKGFKTIMLGNKYEILSKDSVVKTKRFNTRICVWSKEPKMSVRFSTTVPVAKPIESLDRWLR